MGRRSLRIETAGRRVPGADSCQSLLEGWRGSARADPVKQARPTSSRDVAVPTRGAKAETRRRGPGIPQRRALSLTACAVTMPSAGTASAAHEDHRGHRPAALRGAHRGGDRHDDGAALLSRQRGRPAPAELHPGALRRGVDRPRGGEDLHPVGDLAVQPVLSRRPGARTARRSRTPSPAARRPARCSPSGSSTPSSTASQSLSASSEDQAVQWRVLLIRVTMDGSGQPAILVLATDLGPTNRTVAQFAAVFLFFALHRDHPRRAMTRLLVTTTFAPLRKVEATAARFADGDYSQRMTGAPPNTEVGRLTRSLNTMLARIDRALDDRTRTIEQMRRFIGDASHELRTPLVTVRGYAELYRMGALAEQEDVAQAMERIEKEAIRMTELVQDLLELARPTRPADAARPRRPAAARARRRQGHHGLGSRPHRHRDRAGRRGPRDPRGAGAARGRRHPAAVDLPRARGHPDPPDPDPPTRARRHPPGRLLTTGPQALGAALSRLVPRSRRRPPPEPEAPRSRRRRTSPRSSWPRRTRSARSSRTSSATRCASPAGSPLEIGVGVDPAARRAVVAVIDHGEGCRRRSATRSSSGSGAPTSPRPRDRRQRAGPGDRRRHRQRAPGVVDASQTPRAAGRPSGSGFRWPRASSPGPARTALSTDPEHGRPGGSRGS